jgi:WD40 repeat protein
LEGQCTFDNDLFAPGPDCDDTGVVFGDFLDWVDFSPDGTMLAVSGYSTGTAGVWDARTGDFITALPGLDPTPSNDVVLRFNPTSDLLAVAGPSRLTVFETEEWTQVATLPLQYAWNLEFTPEGNHLLATDFTDGIVTIDTSTWQYVGEPMLGHDGVIRDMDVDQDGSLVASGGSDGLVRVWDIRTGQSIHTIAFGETAAVTLVHFVNDRHILVVSQDQPAVVVTIDVPELIEIARSRVTRGFADDECVTYHIEPCPDLERIRGG